MRSWDYYLSHILSLSPIYILYCIHRVSRLVFIYFSFVPNLVWGEHLGRKCDDLSPPPSQNLNLSSSWSSMIQCPCLNLCFFHRHYLLFLFCFFIFPYPTRRSSFRIRTAHYSLCSQFSLSSCYIQRIDKIILNSSPQNLDPWASMSKLSIASSSPHPSKSNPPCVLAMRYQEVRKHLQMQENEHQIKERLFLILKDFILH